MSETTPLLTQADWENEGVDVIDGLVDLSLGIIDVRLGGPAGSREETRDRAVLAALLLRDTPFGSTWKDVDGMRALATWLDNHVTGEGPWFYDSRSLRDHADRIAALLPPREEAR